MTLWPLAGFWLVVLVGLRGPPAYLLYALLACMPFASLAVVPAELTSGLTITPAPVLALLMVVRCLGSRDGLLWFVRACTTPGPLTPLLLFWFVAIFATLFAPSFFEGEVEVILMRGEPGELSRSVPLAPSLQQFSQLGYLSVSVLVVFACARLLGSAKARQHALRAMALGAVVLFITGALDWFAQHVDLDWLLAPLRTATYSIATDSRIGDLEMKRVSGVTPEPAMFGPMCVTYMATLWFFRPVMTGSWMRAACPALCLLLGMMAFLSTSTTAYVALVVFVLVVMGELLWRLISSRRHTRARRKAWSHNRRLIVISLSVFLAFVMFPQAYTHLADVIDTVVLKKTESASFDERSLWTSVSLQSAIDTHGMGVGLGGTRASNSAIAMLSNVGVAGLLLYVSFLATTYLYRPSKGAPDGGAWLSAYRWSVPVVIAPGLISGTTADFGPYLALLFGGTLALQRGARVERLLGSVDRRPRRRRRTARRRLGGFLLPRFTGRESSGHRERSEASDDQSAFDVAAVPVLDLGTVESSLEVRSPPMIILG